MRAFIYLLSVILLCSCSFGSKEMKNATEQSIKQLSQIGKSTNKDVLQKMKKPQFKTVCSNGKYMYSYTYTKINAFAGYKNLMSSPFSKTLILENDSYGNTKAASFTFDNNNILTDIYIYDVQASQIVSKYQFMDISIKPEIDSIRDLKDNDFLRKITIGMKKGMVFRIIGKPHFSVERNGEETWTFSKFNAREFVESMDEASVAASKDPIHAMTDGMFSLPSTGKKLDHIIDRDFKSFNIVFKNDTVIDRYVSKAAELTAEEKSYIGK